MPSAIHIACRLAQIHPDATVLCPECGAQLRGANLGRHLEDVHGPPAGGDDDRFEWSGADRLIAWPLLVLPFAIAAAAVLRDWRNGEPVDRPLFLFASVAMLATIVLGWVALSDVTPFRARLTIAADGSATLRHTLGLFRRRTGPVRRVTVGRARERKPDPTTSGTDDVYSSIEVAGGTYLSLHGRRRTITLRCRRTRLRKIWAGWEQGRPRRLWNATLDPAAFTQLQYALFELGLLTLRTDT